MEKNELIEKINEVLAEEFEIEVFIDNVAYARAISSSKKNAEIEAAKEALKLYLQKPSQIDNSVKTKSKKARKKSDKNV